MDPVERLLAIEDIRQLKARYFRLMDTKDWAGLEAVFAPDAVFDLREVESVRDPVTGAVEPPTAGEDSVFRGHAAVLKMIRTALETLISVHHGHMGEIEILSPTTARGIWAMEDLILDAPSQGGLRFRGYGHYHETYAKGPDGWQIQTTRITRLWRQLPDAPA